MKKILKALSVVFAIMLVCLSLAGCNGTGDTFGSFSYNGNYLTAFAKSSITATEAKTMITNNTTFSARGNGGASAFSMNPAQPEKYPAIELSKVDELITRFAKLDVTTLYYGEDQIQHQRIDILQGTDFKNMLIANEHVPFSQLLVKGIIMMPEIIDYMEKCNQIFKVSEEAKIAPFTDIFTYHVDKDGHLVIRTRDFAEIPSSIGGGVGCSYLQETEILYDGENKMQKWQTSLGVFSSTPNGTLRQGYILEISLDWVLKV